MKKNNLLVTIDLDKPRHLKYGLRALKMMEDTTGKTMSEMNENGMSVSDIGVMLWAGLAHEDSTLTPDIVLDLIDDYGDMKELGDKLKEAQSIAYGEGKNVLSPITSTKK